MNNILEYKGYYGTVEFSEADNVFFGEVMGIRGLISYEGGNVQSLKKDFEGTIDFYLETCKEEGIKPQKSRIGKLNVRVSPELHKNLEVYSILHGQSLDSTVEEAIKHFLQ